MGKGGRGPRGRSPRACPPPTRSAAPQGAACRRAPAAPRRAAPRAVRVRPIPPLSGFPRGAAGRPRRSWAWRRRGEPARVRVRAAAAGCARDEGARRGGRGSWRGGCGLVRVMQGCRATARTGRKQARGGGGGGGGRYAQSRGVLIPQRVERRPGCRRMRFRRRLAPACMRNRAASAPSFGCRRSLAGTEPRKTAGPGSGCVDRPHPLNRSHIRTSCKKCTLHSGTAVRIRQYNLSTHRIQKCSNSRFERNKQYPPKCCHSTTTGELERRIQ